MYLPSNILINYSQYQQGWGKKWLLYPNYVVKKLCHLKGYRVQQLHFLQFRPHLSHYVSSATIDGSPITAFALRVHLYNRPIPSLLTS